MVHNSSICSLSSSEVPTYSLSDTLRDNLESNVVDPIPDTTLKVPVGGTGGAGKHSYTEQTAIREDALTAVQQITKPLLPTPAVTFQSATITDSGGASEAMGQAQSSASTEPELASNVKPITTDTNQNQARSLGDRIHSSSPAWSYHSDWSDDLHPPHQNPPTPLTTYQALAALRTLVLETPLTTSASQNPNPPSGGSRHNGLGRGTWHAIVDCPGTRRNG